MYSNKIRLLSSFGLMLAAIIWGFAFVVVKSSLDLIPPIYMLAFRFTLAAAALTLIMLPLNIVLGMFDNTISLLLAGNSFWELENRDDSAIYYPGMGVSQEERLDDLTRQYNDIASKYKKLVDGVQSELDGFKQLQENRKNEIRNTKSKTCKCKSL